MDKLILVLYVNVGNLSTSDIDQYVRLVTETLTPDDVIKRLDATLFVIPTRTGETRIEAINPKYITDKEIHQNFNDKLNELTSTVNKLTLEKTNYEK